jgi:hypothetical protein
MSARVITPFFLIELSVIRYGLSIAENLYLIPEGSTWKGVFV